MLSWRLYFGKSYQSAGDQVQLLSRTFVFFFVLCSCFSPVFRRNRKKCVRDYFAVGKHWVCLVAAKKNNGIVFGA